MQKKELDNAYFKNRFTLLLIMVNIIIEQIDLLTVVLQWLCILVNCKWSTKSQTKCNRPKGSQNSVGLTCSFRGYKSNVNKLFCSDSSLAGIHPMGWYYTRGSVWSYFLLKLNMSFGELANEELKGEIKPIYVQQWFPSSKLSGLRHSLSPRMWEMWCKMKCGYVGWNTKIGNHYRAQFIYTNTLCCLKL